MADIFTKKKRSEVMSRIRSRRTRPEMRFHGILKGRKIAHKMWPDLPGHPDCLIGKKTVVFVHGCFWHQCPKHFRLPKTNSDFWWGKMVMNRTRHAVSARTLRRMGYKVLVVWEHDLRGKNYSLFLKKRA